MAENATPSKVAATRALRRRSRAARHDLGRGQREGEGAGPRSRADLRAPVRRPAADCRPGHARPRDRSRLAGRRRHRRADRRRRSHLRRRDGGQGDQAVGQGHRRRIVRRARHARQRARRRGRDARPRGLRHRRPAREAGRRDDLRGRAPDGRRDRHAARRTDLRGDAVGHGARQAGRRRRRRGARSRRCWTDWCTAPAGLERRLRAERRQRQPRSAARVEVELSSRSAESRVNEPTAQAR